MNVLVTGAFGTLGRDTLRELVRQGHCVRAFDIDTRVNRKAASRIGVDIEVRWGDIRSRSDVQKALAGQDAAVHLAFILPPASEKRPGFAGEVNVDGSRNLIEAAAKQAGPPTIVFASTFCVHGITQHLDPPIKASGPLRPTNAYTRHKIAVEDMLRESAPAWVTLRFGVVLSPDLKGPLDPIIFEFPPDDRVEFIHSRDAALALATAIACPEARGRALLVGGGEGCRIRYRDLFGGPFEALGVGRLPDEVFSKESKHGGDWMDTAESQELLQYQRHSFNDFLGQVRSEAGCKRPIIRLLGPLIRAAITRRSPFL